MDIELILGILGIFGLLLVSVFLKWLVKTKLFLIVFYVPYLFLKIMFFLPLWLIAEMMSADDEIEYTRKEIIRDFNKICEIFGL